MLRHLGRWRGFARIQSGKRALRDLEQKKQKSRDKVNDFLNNLQTVIKKQDLLPEKPKIPQKRNKAVKQKEKTLPDVKANNTGHGNRVKSVKMMKSPSVVAKDILPKVQTPQDKNRALNKRNSIDSPVKNNEEHKVLDNNKQKSKLTRTHTSPDLQQVVQTGRQEKENRSLE